MNEPKLAAAAVPSLGAIKERPRVTVPPLPPVEALKLKLARKPSGASLPPPAPIAPVPVTVSAPEPETACPRCRKPLAATVSTSPGSYAVCTHCLGFLEFTEVGPRSFLPGDLDRLDEDLRWQLLRQRAELRPER